jgi:hypothetical protein
MTDAQSNLVSVAITTVGSIAFQLVDFLRSRGAEHEATQIESALAASDPNLKLVIQRSREARGLPPLGA